MDDELSRRRGGKRPGAGRKPAPGESYSAAKRRKESALADLRQLEAQQKRGQLVPAEAVVREWEGIVRSVRAGILAVPSRFRARCPEVSATAVAILAEELRSALVALAEGGGEA